MPKLASIFPAYRKLMRTIYSCENLDQLWVAERLKLNFKKMYKTHPLLSEYLPLAHAQTEIVYTRLTGETMPEMLRFKQ